MNILMFFFFSFCFSENISITRLPGTELQSLLENKGGLHVSDYGQFGDLMIGEKREMVFWIQ